MVLYTEYFRYGLGDFHPDFDDDYTLYYFPFLDEIETINLCDQWTPSPTPCNNDDCYIRTPSPTPCDNDDCHNIRTPSPTPSLSPTPSPRIKDKPIIQWWNSWFGN